MTPHEQTYEEASQKKAAVLFGGSPGQKKRLQSKMEEGGMRSRGRVRLTTKDQLISHRTNYINHHL